jgi:hypothetical protein
VPDNEFILLIFTSLIGLSLLIPSLPLAHFFFFFFVVPGLTLGLHLEPLRQPFL